MYWIFNKQYRTEEGIISQLVKNLKKSKIFLKYHENNTEIYELDNINIRFTYINQSLIVVTDKAGNEIVSMDCTYSNMDEVQQVRTNWFHSVLKIARARADQEKQKYEKQKELEQARKEIEAQARAKQQQQVKENAMLNALNQLKNLSK